MITESKSASQAQNENKTASTVSNKPISAHAQKTLIQYIFNIPGNAKPCLFWDTVCFLGSGFIEKQLCVVDSKNVVADYLLCLSFVFKF